jgi:hypothetical protein
MPTEKIGTKVIIAIVVIMSIFFAILTALYVYFESAIATVYEETNFTNEAARNITINVLCEYGYSPQNCPISVFNSTGDKINVTVMTVVSKSAEYKGNEKVYEYFKKDVNFRELNDCLIVDVNIIGGSTMFALRPPWAGVDIYIPAGTNYKINQISSTNP